MLYVCASSTDVDLTTTGFVKNLLGTTSTANDAAISAAIRAASRWAETYLGYPLTLQSYQETLPGYGVRNLTVSRTPIRAVRRLFDSTDTGGEANEFGTSEFRVEDREAGFLSRDEGWEWGVPADFDLTARPKVGQEFRPWLVDYDAGWTYNGVTTDSVHWSTVGGTTSTGRTLPEDIELAVARRAENIYTGADEVTGEALGDLKVNYGSGGTDSKTGQRTSIAERLLDPYRRMV